MSSTLSSSALGSSVNSTLSAMSPQAMPPTSAHTLWMSADVVWALFLVLLALSMLVSLRFDWLRVWWLDQWRQLSGADSAEDPLSDAISLPGFDSSSVASSLPRSRSAPPPILPTEPTGRHGMDRQGFRHPQPLQQPRAHSLRTSHALTPAHRCDRPHTPLLTTAGTAQRPLFHRSGRRH